jgi:hypothetical protein
VPPPEPPAATDPADELPAVAAGEPGDPEVAWRERAAGPDTDVTAGAVPTGAPAGVPSVTAVVSVGAAVVAATAAPELSIGTEAATSPAPLTAAASPARIVTPSAATGELW